jgi:hypothetical protein
MDNKDDIVILDNTIHLCNEVIELEGVTYRSCAKCYYLVSDYYYKQYRIDKGCKYNHPLYKFVGRLYSIILTHQNLDVDIDIKEDMINNIVEFKYSHGNQEDFHVPEYDIIFVVMILSGHEIPNRDEIICKFADMLKSTLSGVASKEVLCNT